MADVDWDEFLDDIYERRGIAASLDLGTAGTFDRTVINKTEGVLLEAGHGLSFATSKPAVCVRGSELNAKSIARAALDNASITFNSQTWKIVATQPKPKPSGAGELYLILQER